MAYLEHSRESQRESVRFGARIQGHPPELLVDRTGHADTDAAGT